MEKINEQGNVAHYSSLGNLANILHDKKIRLGSVSKLADPRESSLGWLGSIGIGHGTTPEEYTNALKTKQLISNVGEQLKILCAVGEKPKTSQFENTIESTIYGRPRMWSQYGDNSRGFCLVLKKEPLSQAIKLFAKDPNHLISANVEYLDWLHIVSDIILIEYGIGIDPTKKNVFSIINQNRRLSSIFFKKGMDWCNENEFRWLLFTEDREPAYVSIENALEAVVLGFNFPLNQITQAILYCKELGCPCYILDYRHPKYLALRLADSK